MQAAHKTCDGCGGEFAGGEIFCPVDGLRLRGARAARAASGDPLIGVLLGERYRVLRVVGEGGMGIVYEAEHVVIEKRVALKVLRDDFSRRPDVVERFRQEARSASRIGHRHIVDISDFGETPSGSSYFVMEMLQGEDLADVLARDAALSPMRAVGIIHQCCRALAAAHDKGIVHRDLKPENIFLTEREGQPDFVKIVDFGVAKMSDIETLGGPGRRLTKTGMIFGTPEYMSPEQAAGKVLDHRVDIYALGVMLHELVTGKVPFEGDNFMEVLSKHANDEVVPLKVSNPGVRVSPELEVVIFRALEKDPCRRFQTMAELARALEAVPELPANLFRESSLPPAWSLVPPPAPPERDTGSSPPGADGQGSGAVASHWRRRGTLALAALGLAALGVTLALWGREPAGAGGLRSLPTAVVGVGAIPAASPGSEQGPQGSAEPHAPQPAPSPGTSPGASPVRIRVTTKPSGASVRVAGRGEVCLATPCEFEAEAGAALSMSARRGRATANADVVPNEHTELHLILRSSTPVPRKEDGVVGDLKIPAAFR